MIFVCDPLINFFVIENLENPKLPIILYSRYIRILRIASDSVSVSKEQRITNLKYFAIALGQRKPTYIHIMFIFCSLDIR